MNTEREQTGIESSTEQPTDDIVLSTTDFVGLVGTVIAVVGFVFVVFYTLVEVTAGTYLGADPGFGLSTSLLVLIIGVAIVALVWLVSGGFVLTRWGRRRLRER